MCLLIALLTPGAPRMTDTLDTTTVAATVERQKLHLGTAFWWMGRRTRSEAVPDVTPLR